MYLCVNLFSFFRFYFQVHRQGRWIKETTGQNAAEFLDKVFKLHNETYTHNHTNILTKLPKILLTLTSKKKLEIAQDLFTVSLTDWLTDVVYQVKFDSKYF